MSGPTDAAGGDDTPPGTGDEPRPGNPHPGTADNPHPGVAGDTHPGSAENNPAADSSEDNPAADAEVDDRSWPGSPAETDRDGATPISRLPADHPDRMFAPESSDRLGATGIDLTKSANPSLLAPEGSGVIGGEAANGDREGPPGPADSLSPAERVRPTWTDPTARRASDLIGGPLGRHAQVGRNRLLTPLRVCLALAIVVLIFGWLFKSACIQQGGDPQSPSLDQSGERPWLTGCYNDIVPLYGSRGFDRPQDFPYSNSFIELNSGGERRIYPRNIVDKSGDSFIAHSSDGRTITLSDEDVIGDEKSGYEQLIDGEFVPVDDISELGLVRFLEYPVLSGLFQWGVSWATEGYLTLAEDTGVVPVPLDVAAYFTIGAIFLALFYLWAVACTAKMARKRIWDTAIMCLSPLLVIHAFTNWDLLAVGLTAGGMYAWSRKKPILSGALFGLGMAAKLYPILMLGPLLVLCLRTGKMRAWFLSLGAAVVAWAIVNVPVILQYPKAWYEFIRLNSERPPEWDSWYFLYANITGSTIWDKAPGEDIPSFLNNLSLALFLVGCAAVGWLALAAKRRPRFAQLAFLVVAVFLLTNKVWSPQYSIWLVPLVALALPRWRPVIVWQISEVVVWMLLMFQFAGVDNKGLSVHPFVGAALIRGALLIMLMVMVIRDINRPERDLVRRTGDDDPTGGILENLPDRFTLPSLPALVGKVVGLRRRPGAWPEGTLDDAGAAHDAGAARPAGGRPALALVGPDQGGVNPGIVNQGSVNPGSVNQDRGYPDGPVQDWADEHPTDSARPFGPDGPA